MSSYVRPADDSAHTGNVVGGHKANLKNPRTSEESKEHSRQQIDELEDSGALDRGARDGDEFAGKNPGNVVGGYKAFTPRSEC